MQGMRVYVYVDGFNLYYRALKGTSHRWLDLYELSKRLLNPGDNVERVNYFTARVKARAGDPNGPRTQQLYLSALDTLPQLTIHYGRFIAKTKHRPLVAPPHDYVHIKDTEEKGSDVNLAVHLLNDAWHDRYDVALVMSQDTDLIEPLKIVKEERSKVVGLIWLDGKQPSRHMQNASSFVRHLSVADLSASQFPARIQRVDGSVIEKPINW